MGYKRFLLLIAVSCVIASVPLSRAEATGYLQTNLVSDKPAAAAAAHTDSNLVNPWGVAFFPGGPFWISDNGTGVSTLYDGTGTTIPLTVTIPAPAGDTNPERLGLPAWFGTAVRWRFRLAGLRALFIWATEDGTIAAWQGALSPITEAVTVGRLIQTL